jgi:hypothetical protein
MNLEALNARKIYLWKFLNPFLAASHLPYFYNLHKKANQVVFGVLLILLFHYDVPSADCVDLLYSRYTSFHRSDF